MTHTFTVPTEVFEALQGTRRHLFVKDNTRLSLEDKALIHSEDGRDELQFDITYIEHGPGSKHVSARYCLIGLYAPYTVQDDIPGSVGGQLKAEDIEHFVKI